jgi:hypothetical protein
VVGVTQTLFSLCNGAFDSGGNKFHPCGEFSTFQFHAFFDGQIEDWPVTCEKQRLLGAQSVNLEAQFVNSFAFFLIVVVPVQILVSQDPCFPEMGPQMVWSECEPSIA